MRARQDPDATSGESLVPPRPNLGPEPWPESSPWAGNIVFLVGFVVVLLIGWIRRKPRSIPPAKDHAPAVDFDRSPVQRFVALSEAVRGALLARFGPAWGSKTTEEIGGDPALVSRLDPNDRDRLVAFLELADRVKFGSTEPESLDDWETWASAFVASVKAGATSRINGQ